MRPKTIGLPLTTLTLLLLTNCQTTRYPGPGVKTAARVTVMFKS